MKDVLTLAISIGALTQEILILIAVSVEDNQYSISARLTVLPRAEPCCRGPPAVPICQTLSVLLTHIWFYWEEEDQ